MVVLMYHDIVTAADKSSGFQNENAFQYKVEKTAFEEHVKALRGKDVVFTFDDGGESSITMAAPILEKYGFKGVFFISTKYLDTQGFLTTKQVKALVERGHLVGSHSHSHPDIFTNLSKNEIRKEWQKSFEILKTIIGSDGLILSIPNGYASKTIIDEAINAGYSDIYTSKPTTKVRIYRHHKVIGRFVVHNGTTTENVLRIVESSLSRLKMTMKWRLLSFVKWVLGASYESVKATVLHH